MRSAHAMSVLSMYSPNHDARTSVARSAQLPALLDSHLAEAGERETKVAEGSGRKVGLELIMLLQSHSESLLAFLQQHPPGTAGMGEFRRADDDAGSIAEDALVTTKFTLLQAWALCLKLGWAAVCSFSVTCVQCTQE